MVHSNEGKGIEKRRQTCDRSINTEIISSIVAEKANSIFFIQFEYHFGYNFGLIYDEIRQSI